MKIISFFSRISFVIVLIFNALILNAQLKIHYYTIDDSLFPNASIVNISESSAGELMLLCENSDLHYQNQKIKVIKTNESGVLSSQETKDVNNLMSTLKLVRLNDNAWNIYGNTSLNDIINSTTIELDSSGKIGKEKTEANALSSKLSDVCKSPDNSFMMVYTKIGKQGKYNIELKKTSEDGSIKWLKTISSESNEEASQMQVTNADEVYILGKKYNEDLTSYVPIMYKVDSDGNNIWKKGIEATGEFNVHFFSLKSNGNILYACSYTKNQTGSSETEIIELSDKGDQLNQSFVNKFSANGIKCIKEDECILFGSEFLINTQQVVTKAKYIILNNELTPIESRALNNKDKPDVELTKKMNTSSDYNTACVLNNGNIALGGKVYMPKNKVSNERSNHPLLVIINRK